MPPYNCASGIYDNICIFARSFFPPGENAAPVNRYRRHCGLETRIDGESQAHPASLKWN